MIDMRVDGLLSFQRSKGTFDDLCIVIGIIIYECALVNVSAPCPPVTLDSVKNNSFYRARTYKAP